MENTKAHEKLTNLAVLVVFGVFAVCLLLVVLTGAEVYRGITDRGDAAFQNRTAVRYLTARVWQADSVDAVSVEPFGDKEALVFREILEGTAYLTRIYCHEGYIRELFTAEDGSFSPEDGEKIIQAEGLSFGMEDGLLVIRLCLTDGTQNEMRLLLRSGGEELP